MDNLPLGRTAGEIGFEFGKVARDVVAEADLVRLADGDVVLGAGQQPGAIVGHDK